MITTPPDITRTAVEKRLERRLNLAYRENVRGLTARALYKTQNKATSEDLVQKTFMKTWVYLIKGGNIDLMRAFLYHVLNDLVIDEYRKRKTLSLDELLSNGFEPSSGDFKRPQAVFDGKIALELIEQLPKKYRHVMKMRYGEDLSLKEMSERTGQSKNTVAVQAYRGLEKLKVLYNH